MPVCGLTKISRKVVILLSAAEWRCVRDLNKMATLQKKGAVLLPVSCYKDCDDGVEDIDQDLERTHLLKTRLQSGIKSLQRPVASARRVGRAGHGAVTQMWNELGKLFHAAHQSIRRANKQLTVATRNCLTGSEERLHMKPYRLLLLHALSDNDKDARSAFCVYFPGISEDENLMSGVVFSEKALFMRPAR
jgi:hypothetical protein